MFLYWNVMSCIQEENWNLRNNVQQKVLLKLYESNLLDIAFSSELLTNAFCNHRKHSKMMSSLSKPTLQSLVNISNIM